MKAGSTPSGLGLSWLQLPWLSPTVIEIQLFQSWFNYVV
jgi:hypothetical protein